MIKKYEKFLKTLPLNKINELKNKVIANEDTGITESCPYVNGDSAFKNSYRRLVWNTKRIWYLNKGNEENVSEVMQAAGGSLKFGVWVSIIVFLFFFVWAGLAPLDSASIASGTVVLYSNRKTVQHLEGGIVQDILVEEGDEVATGQPLIRLNYTSANAQQEVLMAQLRLAQATEARLVAERDGSESVEFNNDLIVNKDNPEVAKIIEAQEKLFITKSDAIRGQIDILQQRILQFGEQIQGLEAQKVAARDQLALIKEELKAKKILLDKGWGEKPEYLALKRAEADLSGRQAEYSAEVARVNESITETQMQILSVQNEALKQTLEELKEVQAQIADLQERLNASRDVLERTVITAPQAGKVTGLKVHTVGGVINPGEPLMDIVPTNDKLIVEAQVSVTDIDIVHAGLDAKIMLSAYKSRVVPRLGGKVIDVSADRFTDEKTGFPYFRARVEIPTEEIEKLPENVVLYPGMPAEVFIVTGESTFLGYLMDPIINSFRRSFREK